jgi:hypothetical protein
VKIALTREEIEPIARLYLSTKNVYLFMLHVDILLAAKAEHVRLPCPRDCGKKLAFVWEAYDCCMATPDGKPCGLLCKKE